MGGDGSVRDAEIASAYLRRAIGEQEDYRDIRLFKSLKFSNWLPPPKLDTL